MVVCPRLRNSDHNRQWKFHTTHYQELQCIIKHCGIGTRCIDYRKHLGQLTFQVFRLHGLLAGQHLIGVTLDCIDLTIMYHKAVRMCTLPARICVCGESGMNHCNGRFIIRILQIFEKQTQLVYEEHSFVNNRSA